jgi:hypothetical protein
VPEPLLRVAVLAVGLTAIELSKARQPLAHAWAELLARHAARRWGRR